MNPSIHDGLIPALEPLHMQTLLRDIYERQALGEPISIEWFEEQVRHHTDEIASDRAGNPDDAFNITSAQYFEAISNSTMASDGELEFDDGAVVSRSSDEGAYVQAWAWIGDDTVRNILPGIPKPVCRVCGSALAADPDGSPGVIAHMTENSEMFIPEDDHAAVPEIGKPKH